MDTKQPTAKESASCPMDFILRMLMGPWTTYILYNLKTHGPQRFGELFRLVQVRCPPSADEWPHQPVAAGDEEHEDSFREFFDSCEQVVVPEASYEGQYAALLRDKYGVRTTPMPILGGLPLSPEKMAQKIVEVHNEAS